jgi:hypothetical protein
LCSLIPRGLAAARRRLTMNTPTKRNTLWRFFCRNKYWFINCCICIDRLVNIEFAFQPFNWELSYRDYGTKMINFGPFSVYWSTY